jgi:hypothetical protein
VLISPQASGDNKSGPFVRKLSNIYTKATLVGEEFETIDDQTVRLL